MSSVKKYLLFAVGAIALMSIGILLNMQINNWNESRKEALQEYVLYAEAYPGIQSQIKALVDQIFKDGAAKDLAKLDAYHLNSAKFSRLENDAILSYEQGKELEETFYGNNDILYLTYA